MAKEQKVVAKTALKEEKAAAKLALKENKPKKVPLRKLIKSLVNESQARKNAQMANPPSVPVSEIVEEQKEEEGQELDCVTVVEEAAQGANPPFVPIPAIVEEVPRGANPLFVAVVEEQKEEPKRSSSPVLSVEVREGPKKLDRQLRKYYKEVKEERKALLIEDLKDVLRKKQNSAASTIAGEVDGHVEEMFALEMSIDGSVRCDSDPNIVVDEMPILALSEDLALPVLEKPKRLRSFEGMAYAEIPHKQIAH